MCADACFGEIGCQDIDDALHAKRLSNGNIEAGVRKFGGGFLLYLFLAFSHSLTSLSLPSPSPAAVPGSSSPTNRHSRCIPFRAPRQPNGR